MPNLNTPEVSTSSEDDKSDTVLLVIDVVNDFEFEGGQELLTHALPIAPNIARLKERASLQGIPAIYVNDNFGRWQSDFRSQVERCLAQDVRGKPIVELLAPKEGDYFVLKPMHSGFYATALPVLLERLGAQRLILTGFASNICVLFTAHDAHMRKYKLIVPQDCSAAETEVAHRYTMDQLSSVIGSDIRPFEEILLEGV